MQIRGGRGYETAESLKARGEKAVPVEQVMRDMRINRIFEGSTEIMHLLIAREAVDQHLSVAGDILEPDTELKDKARSAVAAGAFYATWLPQLAAGKGQNPGSYDEFGELAEHVRFAERALAQARPLHVLRHEPLAGRAGEAPGVAGPDRGHRRRAVRHLLRRGLRPHAAPRSTPSGPSRRASWPTSSAPRPAGAPTTCSATCGRTTTTRTTPRRSRCSTAATR